MNDAHIESLLRQAPKPPPPSGLKQRLLSDIRLSHLRPASDEVAKPAAFWLRWTPALPLGIFFLGCLIVLGIQTSQMLELQRENESLRAATSEREPLRQDAVELERLRTVQREMEKRGKQGEELLKLKAEVEVLRGQIGELPALQAENRRLQAERAALSPEATASPVDDPFAQMKEKADSTKCINNLKQIGLAARMWANDHKTNALPLEWLMMKKELSTPKVLTCPADTARKPAITWEQFDGSSVSYEFPSATPDERDPYVVYSRCPIHGCVGLSDGSVQSKLDPSRLQRVDGNLKLQNNATKGTRP